MYWDKHPSFLVVIIYGFFLVCAPAASAQYSPSSTQSPSSSGNQQGYGTPFGIQESAAGALVGAVVGAGSGAIIGSHKGKAGQGAAIGAGLGAVSGYLVGRQLQERSQSLSVQQQVIEQQRQAIAHNRALLEELKRRNLDARETPRGVVVNLPDILFSYDSARLTRAARSEVGHIAEVLNSRGRSRRISVEGHTDAIGSDAYNQTLSERRAASVSRALASQGVRSLTIHGYGEKYPVAPNIHADGSDNPAGRAKNRRVEVVIANDE